jgi:hypothetical protein
LPRRFKKGEDSLFFDALPAAGLTCVHLGKRIFDIRSSLTPGFGVNFAPGGTPSLFTDALGIEDMHLDATIVVAEEGI